MRQAVRLQKLPTMVLSAPSKRLRIKFLAPVTASRRGHHVCVAPPLARLFEEASQHGLVLLSIDEDGEAETAMQFMVKNKHDWPNFHDDGEIVRRFPNQGIRTLY